MKVPFTYRMHGISEALDALNILDKEFAQCLTGLGLVLLLDGSGHASWYVFAHSIDLNSRDWTRIASVFQSRGIRTDLTALTLMRSPRVGFVKSGKFDHIVAGLGDFAAGGSVQ